MPVKFGSQAGGAGNRRHDADRQALLFEHRPLLDVQFDIGEQFAAGSRGRADMFGVEPELGNRLAHRNAGAVADVEHAFVERAGYRAAAEQRGGKPHPSSSAKPVTSIANGNRRPLRLRSATQEIAAINPSGPSHLPASRTVS